MRLAKKIDAPRLFVSQRNGAFVNVFFFFLYTLRIKVVLECVNSSERMFLRLNSSRFQWEFYLQCNRM